MVRSIRQRYEGSDAEKLLEAIRAVNSDLQLSTLISSVVRVTSELTGSDSAVLWLNENGGMRCVAGTGLESTVGHKLQTVDQWPPLRQMRTDLQPVYIADTSRHMSWSDMLHAFPDAERIKTWLGLPLVQDDRLLGFLGIGYIELADYQVDQSNVLAEFSRHVARALANAMVFAEETSRARLAVLRTSIDDALRDSRDHAVLAARAAAAIGQMMDLSWCALYLGIDQSMPRRAGVYAGPGVILDGRIGDLLPRILGLTTHHQRPLVISDIAGRHGVEPVIDANRETLLAGSVRSLLIAPLTMNQNTVGAIVLLQTSQPREWASGEIMLVEQVAMDVAIALEQAQAFEALDAQRHAAQGERDMLQTLALQAPVGLIVADLPPHSFRFWNSAATSLAESGTSMSASGPVEPPHFHVVHADGKPFSQEQWPIERAYREGVAVGAEEWLLRRRDGSHTPVSVSAMPVTDAENHVTAVIGVIQDMTLQRQIEARASQAEAYVLLTRQLLGQVALTAGRDDAAVSLAATLRATLPFDACAVSLDVIPADSSSHDLAWSAVDDGQSATDIARAAAAFVHESHLDGSARIDDILSGTQGDSPAARLASAGFRTALLVPVEIDGGVLGTAGFFGRTSGLYQESSMSVARYIGAALAVTHLQQVRFREYQQDVTRIERERMAREMHDVLAQMITSIVLQLERALQASPGEAAERETLEQARNTARLAVAETRRIVWNLKAASVNLEDPRSILKEEADKLARRLGVKPEIVVTGEDRALAHEIGTVVQRLARVTFDNIWSHSEATHVRILIDFGISALTLLIEDDGKGFDPAEVDLMSAGRVGLTGVAERARLVGGSLRVESAADQGTRVWCIVPYSPSAPVPKVKSSPSTPLLASATPLMGNNRIRVVLIDDHSMVREGLEHMLSEQPDIQVVGGAATGSDGLRVINELQPDVVLCDLQLPDISGVEVISRVRTLFPDIRCVIVTTYDHDDYIYEGIKSGAKGYVLKDVSSNELAEAVRAAARNESLLQPVVAGKLVDRFGEMARQGDMVEPLTEREIGVLRALATGSRNKEIALQLSLSESTIKTHLASIFGKLGVTTRTEAVTRGRELGLVPL